MRTSFYDLAHQYLTDKLGIRPKSASIFLSLYGLKGSESKTLQETAKDFSMSRERVRQIKEAVIKQFQKQLVRFESSQVDKLFSQFNGLPTSSTDCLKMLDDEIDSILPIFNFLEAFGDKSNDIRCLVPPASEPNYSELIITSGQYLESALAVRIALDNAYAKQKKQKSMAILSINDIAKAASVTPDEALSICRAFYGPYVLDKKHSPYLVEPEKNWGYHLIIPSHDNKILCIIEKQSVLVKGVTIQSLAVTAHRYSRSKGEKQTSPSVEALRIYLTHLYGVDIEHDWIAFTNITPHGPQHLPESERLLLKVLKKGESLDYATLRERLVSAGMNQATMNVCIFRSPLIVANESLYSLISETD